MARSPVVAEFLRDIDEAIARFETRIIEFDAQSISRDDLADIYVALTAKTSGLTDRFRIAISSIGQVLGKMIPFNGTIMATGASIERKGGASSKKQWQHDRIKPVVIEAIISKHVNKETGTIDVPYAVLLTEVLDTVSISGWKSTVCGPLGINVSHYCETGPSQTNLIVRGTGVTDDES